MKEVVISFSYEIIGQFYEGYYVSPSEKAPFILLIHDWNGLTVYEVKRANMLAREFDAHPEQLPLMTTPPPAKPILLNLLLVDHLDSKTKN